MEDKNALVVARDETVDPSPKNSTVWIWLADPAGTEAELQIS
jgi:hypothetical protein